MSRMLDQVEEDIAAAEAYLANPDGGAPTAGSAAAPSPAAAAARGQLSEDKRREIIARLTAEREARMHASLSATSPAPASHHAGGAAQQKHHSVADVSIGAASVSSRSYAGGDAKKDARDQLIQRLLAERAERKNASVLSASMNASAAASDALRSTADAGPDELPEYTDEGTRAAGRLVASAYGEPSRDEDETAGDDDDEDDVELHTLDELAPVLHGQVLEGGGYMPEHHLVPDEDMPEELIAQTQSPAKSSPAKRSPAARTPTQQKQLRPASAQRARPQSAQRTRPQSAQRARPQSARKPVTRTASASYAARSTAAHTNTSARPAQHRGQGRHSLAEARQRREAEEMAECTFKPRINKSRKSTSQDHKLSREERLARLAQPRQAKRPPTVDGVREADEAELTFRPKINSRSRSASRRASNRLSMSFEERLHHEADERQAQREKLKRQREEAEFKRFAYKPELNAASRAIIERKQAQEDHKPIHARIGELQRAKNEKLLRKRMEIELANENLTFKPEIDQVSDLLAQSRATNQLEVTQRLSRSAVEAVHRRFRERDAAVEGERREAAHRPAVNPVSEKIVEQSAFFTGENADFLARQRMFEERKKAKERQLAKQALDETTASRPKISGVSQILVASQPERAHETDAERIERLAFKDKERLDAIRGSMEKSYYKQFDFKPRINKISRMIAKGRTPEELHDDERQRAVRRQIETAAEEAFRREHTFAPDTSKTAAVNKGLNVRSSLANPETASQFIQAHLRERELKREELRKSYEFEELKGCTFKPKTLKSSSTMRQPSGPIMIPGLGRHLELREQARKKVEDKAAREAEVFGPKRRADEPAPLYTIPEPFNLSTDPKAHLRKARIRQEAVATELAECTFKPRTNAHDDADLVRRLLAEEDSGAHGESRHAISAWMDESEAATTVA